MERTSSITEIKGIGKKTQELFGKLGIGSVGDLLAHYPRDYVKYPAIEDLNRLTSLTQERHALLAQALRTPVVRNTGRIPVTLLDIGDEGHRIQLVWFRSSYIRSTVKPGRHYVFFGKVTIRNGHYCMEQPVVYEVEKYRTIEGRLQPVYELTKGVTNNQLSKAIRTVLDDPDFFLPDPVPEEQLAEQQLCDLRFALRQIHFPDSMEQLTKARNRLVFDEFFTFILALQYHKQRDVREENPFEFSDPGIIDRWIGALPYELTGAQLRAIREIVQNMRGPGVMQRLIQGDVGSGKTIVAFLLMAWVSASGYQSAIMAPTEVLAQQHYESFQTLCSICGCRTHLVLLTGSMTRKQKRQAYERLQLFPDAIVIGTHALIQEQVAYDSLALVITDEQHRFGVRQRDVFSAKGEHPHVLVMSATPIPRTLAIILYGDLDISVIDEVPAKRLPVKNCVVGTGYRPKAYEFIRREVRQGHQVYVICPFVEETEHADGENVTDYSRLLTEQFGEEITVGVLHGKMKAELKNSVMEQFAGNQIQVLVSTTVVEVGVNVPNATVMMIENAERFGLAQLHQLRGRVGRGDAQSYCIMMNGSGSKDAQKRLEILNQSNDGFFIAGADLKMRGPGDFFGIRQSGELGFALADVYQDSGVMLRAAAAVKVLLEEDPDLSGEKHAALKDLMEHEMDERLRRMNL